MFMTVPRTAPSAYSVSNSSQILREKASASCPRRQAMLSLISIEYGSEWSTPRRTFRRMG